jgi:ribosomal protein S27AE
MPDLPCPRCGSDAVIPDVRLTDRDNNGAHRTATLGLARKPDALMFKQEERVEIKARVCSDCGHVDFYAADPQALWHAHLDRIAER